MGERSKTLTIGENRKMTPTSSADAYSQRTKGMDGAALMVDAGGRMRMDELCVGVTWAE